MKSAKNGVNQQKVIKMNQIALEISQNHWKSAKIGENLAKKAYGTHYSRVVPHHSTNWAQGSLTSEFGWDLVYPTWYDRMTGEVFAIAIH